MEKSNKIDKLNYYKNNGSLYYNNHYWYCNNCSYIIYEDAIDYINGCHYLNIDKYNREFNKLKKLNNSLNEDTAEYIMFDDVYFYIKKSNDYYNKYMKKYIEEISIDEFTIKKILE